MNVTITLFIVLFFSAIGFSQNLDKKSTNSTVTNTSVLTYSKSTPDTSTYLILKNTSGSPLAKEVLEMINFHRSFNGNETWIVSDDIELLIYKAIK